MERIVNHPILTIPQEGEHTFLFNGKPVTGMKGFTIAAALHQAGYPVHSHSVNGRNRSLNCGIGKCGACEMLVDGEVKRICITKVDNVKEVSEITVQNYTTDSQIEPREEPVEIYRTDVAIIGAGPAGLACRETLKELGLNSIVIDSNDKIGGQFLMQTHAFFFFEKERRFGGMRGFDIAKTLAGDDHSGIFLHSTVWDILQNKRIAVKDMLNHKNFYVEAQALIVATGAVPFMPTFENDDVPGVYTAAVVQKMMNAEFTLLGKNILTVGAGNIGYLTSYQLMQAGAKVKAILEAMPHEGGFPVQANRIRRLGIPIYTSHMLLKAIPNQDRTGITGAVVCECENFKPIPGTEKVIDGIDVINICTGLIPDNQLLTKGQYTFGKRCAGVGDAVRIGEGTTAVLRGKQAAYEIAQELGVRFNYNDYLQISKEYIDSQQHPIRIKEESPRPTPERQAQRPFVRLDCLYGFACNPCSFACPQKAITKSSTSVTPEIDYEKCTGCMQCVSHCPGLAIFGYDTRKQNLFLPVEYEVEEGAEVWLVDDNGKKQGEGIIEKVLKKPTKTNVARVKAAGMENDALLNITGFIVKENYPEEIDFKQEPECESETYVCHCEDVSLDELLSAIGDRKYISVDEVKHITRLGMGPCRGKRCIPRLRMKLREKGIELVGDATPRAPLSTRFVLGEMYPQRQIADTYKVDSGKQVRKTEVLIAGGGIGGSALFRYFSEAGKKTVLINADRGSSWRNIGGGRPAFSIPELAEIARNNQTIFEETQKEYDIHYREIRYITFAHDEATYNDLERSCGWSNAYLIDKKDFQKEVSPYFNTNQNTYFAAQISQHCWQATPGRVIDFIRNKGKERQGEVWEDTHLVEVHKNGGKYHVLLYTHDKRYIEYECDHFVNALGYSAERFARMLGLYTGLYPVKHQALITHRLPNLGKDGDILDMLIDRRKRNDFSAVYGQQFAETGQIIACASPAVDAKAEISNFDELKFNTRRFMEIISEVFCDWIPSLATVPVQATWSGYYVEPRYIIDPDNGLFVGLQGHGFMLAQYLAKLYVDKALGRTVPDYMERLRLDGDGISEKAFK
ncbi:FAD-dependent oxidoreductase [Parabacteroides distasonis]|uniref:FAD-dependent oxidoreductase n=2 Tax=Parabacteroides distasonis TaxID=823 RepID=UPI001C38D6FD|nr:FAD-dependent oxidoreductase [Parabacteroides distasonis]MBV4224502.1 FAD-dependent oxidoreductase [Parabacteroides distasonis]